MAVPCVCRPAATSRLYHTHAELQPSTPCQSVWQAATPASTPAYPAHPRCSALCFTPLPGGGSGTQGARPHHGREEHCGAVQLLRAGERGTRCAAVGRACASGRRIGSRDRWRRVLWAAGQVAASAGALPTALIAMLVRRACRWRCLAGRHGWTRAASLPTAVDGLSPSFSSFSVFMVLYPGRLKWSRRM